MKLKTLKDLYIQGDAYLAVKTEAIKWVKLIKRTEKDNLLVDKLWLNFFNITEKDLE